MPNENAECPKCHGTMELGYTPDYGHGGTVYLGYWIRGRAKRGLLSMFNKLLIGRPQGPAIPIGVYRCQSCGFLEFYARDEFLA